VDAKSYWLYTRPYDNRKRDEAFAAYGFKKGLEFSPDRIWIPAKPKPIWERTMKLFRFAVLLLACLCLHARSHRNAHAGNGARVVKYSPTDVIPIRAKVRFSTLIRS